MWYASGLIFANRPGPPCLPAPERTALSKETAADPKKLAALLKRLKPLEPADVGQEMEPIAQLVLSFLNWETTRRQAQAAFDRVLASVVDLNELRVSLEPEIVEMIGSDYPLAVQRVMRLRQAMNEIYRREHDWRPASIANKSKKEQRAYLETLPGIVPYVVSRMALVTYGGHAMPVDNKLVSLLRREGVVDDTLDAEATESFLLKNIKADEALEGFLKLQGFADESRMQADLETPEPGVPELRLHLTGNIVKAATKKSAKAKKTSKKTTKKPKRK